VKFQPQISIESFERFLAQMALDGGIEVQILVKEDDKIKLSMGFTNISFQKLCLQITMTRNFQFCFVATTIATLLPSCTQPTCIVLYFAKT
jgi:hypothetical protein